MYIHRTAKDLGAKGAKGAKGSKFVSGAKGSKGEQTEQRGAKGAKGSKAYSILDFRVATTWSEESLITTCSVEVSCPPPEHRTTTSCTFTEWQKT